MAISQELCFKWLIIFRRCAPVIIFSAVYSSVLFIIAIRSGYKLDDDAFHTSGVMCLIDLGWFPIYWNLTVSYGVLYLFMAGSYITVVALALPIFLGYWLKIWVILWFAELLVRLGYYFLHCEILPAGILAIAGVGIGVIQVLLALHVSAERWKMQLDRQVVRRRSRAWNFLREDSKHHLTESSRLRLREGLTRALGIHADSSAEMPPVHHPKSFGAAIHRRPDDRWTTKYVSVEKDSEIVYDRE